MEGGIDTLGVLGLMVAAYGKAGHVEEGLTLLAETLATVEKRFFESCREDPNILW
jgi:pentatricopeptide repeat protein